MTWGTSLQYVCRYIPWWFLCWRSYLPLSLRSCSDFLCNHIVRGRLQCSEVVGSRFLLREVGQTQYSHLSLACRGNFSVTFFHLRLRNITSVQKFLRSRVHSDQDSLWSRPETEPEAVPRSCVIFPSDTQIPRCLTYRIELCKIFFFSSTVCMITLIISPSESES